MLQEYRNYIINLRNNLIQCGVAFPINNIRSYEDVYYEADKLRQVLWYYSIMCAIGEGGTMREYFIDLSKYYKDEMRKRFYEESFEYIEGYKKISALANLADETGIQIHSDTGVDIDYEFEIEDPEEDISEDLIEQEIKGTVLDDAEEKTDSFEYKPVTIPINSTILDEVDSIFSIKGVESYTEEYQSMPLPEIFEDIHGIFIEDIIMTDTVEDSIEDEVYVEDTHGTYIEDINIVSVSEIVLDEIHGIFIEDIGNVEVVVSIDFDIHGTFIEEIGSLESVSIDEDIHGTFIEDIGSKKSDENEIHGIFIEDIGNKKVDSEIRGTIIEDIVIVEDSEEFEEDDFEDYDSDDSYYSGEEEEVVYYDTETSFDQVGEDNSNCAPNSETRVVNNKTKQEFNGDLSDLIQQGVNSLLTKGKKVLIKETKKIKTGNYK